LRSILSRGERLALLGEDCWSDGSGLFWREEVTKPLSGDALAGFLIDLLEVSFSERLLVDGGFRAKKIFELLLHADGD
jgi:hypothetical protein